MRKFVLQSKFTNYDSDSFRRYLSELHNIKPLTVEEERLLIEKIEAGDEKAVTELVKRNLRFVVSVAKQYVTPNNLLEDLVNEGNIAMMEAAKKFDTTRGIRFYSYAVWWIRRNMIIYSTQNKTIKLPHNKNFAITKIQEKMDEFEQKHGRPANEDELVLAGFDIKDIKDYFMNDNFLPVSMDTPLSTNGNDELCNLSEAIDSESNYADTELHNDDLKMKINKLLLKIKKDKDREIIIMLFGLNGCEEMSINSVADKLKMTTERIRQIKEASLKKLSKYSEVLL